MGLPALLVGWRAAASAVAAVLFVLGCAGPTEREEAVARLRAEGWSRIEAECYVDLALDGGGSGALDTDAELTPERLDALYQATQRCRELPENAVELEGTSGTAVVSAEEIEDALASLTDDELVAWARLHGYESDSAEPVDVRRQAALRELTLGRRFSFEEALCITDELARTLGTPGLDPSAGATAEEVAAENAAVALCAPTRR